MAVDRFFQVLDILFDDIEREAEAQSVLVIRSPVTGRMSNTP